MSDRLSETKWFRCGQIELSIPACLAVSEQENSNRSNSEISVVVQVIGNIEAELAIAENAVVGNSKPFFEASHNMLRNVHLLVRISERLLHSFTFKSSKSKTGKLLQLTPGIL